MVIGEMIFPRTGVNRCARTQTPQEAQFSLRMNEEIGHGDRLIKMLFVSEKILLASND